MRIREFGGIREDAAAADHTHVELAKGTAVEVSAAEVREFINSGGGGGTAEIAEQIVVAGSALGSFADGQVIPAGTPFSTILTGLLVRQILPSYVSPTLTLASSISEAELGSTISPVLTPAWVQNDGGAISAYRLLKNEVGVYSGAAAIAQTASALSLQADTTFQAQVDYSQGALKQDNLGVDYPTGRIAAGSLNSAVRTIYARRKCFFGVATAWDTSAAIRALPASRLNPQINTTGTVTSVSGAAYVLAYPATLRALTSLTFAAGAFTTDVTAQLTSSTVQVADAAGANAVDYRVYLYKPDDSFAAATLTFKI